MDDFRYRTPARRLKPSIQVNYSNYKPELREDFNERCGYCGDHDFFRNTFYEIDHFVPKKKLIKIKENTYSNLVYSCRSCNNSKREKWPTDSETIHNDGKVGFIDPCCPDFPKQFRRGKDGSIIPESQIGLWIYKALNFANPVHRITWTMERLRVDMIAILNKINAGNADLTVHSRLQQLLNEYLKFEEELKGGTPHF